MQSTDCCRRCKCWKRRKDMSIHSVGGSKVMNLRSQYSVSRHVLYCFMTDWLIRLWRPAWLFLINQSIYSCPYLFVCFFLFIPRTIRRIQSSFKFLPRFRVHETRPADWVALVLRWRPLYPCCARPVRAGRGVGRGERGRGKTPRRPCRLWALGNEVEAS